MNWALEYAGPHSLTCLLYLARVSRSSPQAQEARRSERPWLDLLSTSALLQSTTVRSGRSRSSPRCGCSNWPALDFFRRWFQRNLPKMNTDSMVEEGVQEIVYETHRHSSGPCVPNYPPQQQVPVSLRSLSIIIITSLVPFILNFIVPIFFAGEPASEFIFQRRVIYLYMSFWRLLNL